MEKTGCKIICGAPTTVAVKGLMMMMMRQGEMSHPTTMAGPRSAEEPTFKKIKLEYTPGMHADADDSSQTSDGSTSLTNDACAARTSNALNYNWVCHHYERAHTKAKNYYCVSTENLIP
ncbi:hypothetical protein, partial [Thiolapillus sp.]|uniref:hypothetical protein n=1 Tax=Thiolapillus sp. TaxID=2017437 RepID=UPI003AF46E48